VLTDLSELAWKMPDWNPMPVCVEYDALLLYKIFGGTSL